MKTVREQMSNTQKNHLTEASVKPGVFTDICSLHSKIC